MDNIRKTLKKKAKTFKLIMVKNAKGNVTYKIKVTVTAAGTKEYKAGSKTVIL